MTVVFNLFQVAEPLKHRSRSRDAILTLQVDPACQTQTSYLISRKSPRFDKLGS